MLAAGAQIALAPRIASIARGAYRDKREAELSGSGYVVESLEAALWCFARSASFEEAILRAANLGDDADTTAAVCGQVAGAFCGEPGIPPRWLERFVLRDEIAALARRLCSARGKWRRRPRALRQGVPSRTAREQPGEGS